MLSCVVQIKSIRSDWFRCDKTGSPAWIPGELRDKGNISNGIYQRLQWPVKNAYGDDLYGGFIHFNSSDVPLLKPSIFGYGISPFMETPYIYIHIWYYMILYDMICYVMIWYDMLIIFFHMDEHKATVCPSLWQQIPRTGHSWWSLQGGARKFMMFIFTQLNVDVHIDIHVDKHIDLHIYI